VRRAGVLLTLILGGGMPSARCGAADLEAGRRQASAVCASCHGADGHSTNARAPSLAGQPVFYLQWQLILFRDKRRVDAEMSPFAASLTDAQMGDLAAYYAAQTPAPPPSGSSDPEKMEAGRAAAERYHCVSCHAKDFTGQQYAPRLAGLSYEYLLRQLRGFKAQTRGELDGSMATAAQPLSEQDIENLAQYIASSPKGK
jgi:cytochrome c553